MAVASDLLSAALVLQYAKRHQLASDQLATLDQLVRQAVGLLQVYQGQDGSYSYFRNMKKSPYVTAWVLEGLLAARELGIDLFRTRVGSMSCLFFQPGPVTDFKSASASDTARFAKYFTEMLDQGIYLTPSQYETAFLSTAHRSEHVDRIVEANRKALKAAFA